MGDSTTTARFEQHFVVVDESSGDLDRLAEKTDGLTDANKRAIAIFKELEKEEKAATAAAVADAKAKLSVVAATKEEADEQQKAARIIVKHLREQEAAQNKVDKATEATARTVVKGAEGSEHALKKIGAAIASAFAVSQIQPFVMASAQAFEDIHNLSLEMGITAAQADTLSDAMAVAGVSSDALGAGMARWSAAVKASKDGTGELTGEMAAWSKVGKESLASFPEAMARVAREIQNARTEQEKLVIASSYFGEAGRKLLPLLATGEANVRQASSGEGAFFDEAKVRRAREFRAAMANASDRVEDMKNALALKLFPIIERIADNVLPAMETGAHAASKVIETIADNATTIKLAIMAAATAWAGMKAVDLVSHFAKTASAATAMGAVASGGAGAAAAGGGAAAAGAGGMFGRVGAVAMANPIATSVVAAVAAPIFAYSVLKDDLAAERRLARERRQAIEDEKAAKEAAQVAAENARMGEYRARIEERQAEATKALAKASGITAERLKELGIDAVKLGGSLAQSARAARATAMGATLDEKRASLTGPELEDYRTLSLASRYAKSVRKTLDKYGLEKTASLVGAYDPTDTTSTIGGGRGMEATMTRRLSEEGKQLHKNAVKLAFNEIVGALKGSAEAELRKVFDRGQINVHNNFNGPVTNRVELRNDDPDRVMFAITDSMAKMAAVRTTSRYTPVGTGAP